MFKCPYFHCGTSVTSDGTNVIIAFSDSPTGINDKTRFCFRITQSIPTGTGSEPVLLTVNGSNIPLWDKYGNPVLASELSTRCVYRGYYGATTPHVIVSNLPSTPRCNCSI